MSYPVAGSVQLPVGFQKSGCYAAYGGCANRVWLLQFRLCCRAVLSTHGFAREVITVSRPEISKLHLQKFRYKVGPMLRLLFPGLSLANSS